MAVTSRSAARNQFVHNLLRELGAWTWRRFASPARISSR
jgi:hypothetical protein